MTPTSIRGGDMVRTGGLSYACEPRAKKGARISEMQLRGKTLEAYRPIKPRAGRGQRTVGRAAGVGCGGNVFEKSFQAADTHPQCAQTGRRDRQSGN